MGAPHGLLMALPATSTRIAPAACHLDHAAMRAVSVPLGVGGRAFPGGQSLVTGCGDRDCG